MVYCPLSATHHCASARNDEPAARAVVLVERLFALLHDCRALVPQLEGPGAEPEPVSAQAERLLYFTLVGAIEAGLVRTAEDVLTVLRQASPPLGPMGADWLAQQERRLELDDFGNFLHGPEGITTRSGR